MTSVKVTKIWFKILAMDLTYSDPSRKYFWYKVWMKGNKDLVGNGSHLF